MARHDIIIIGAGPGGYVAAIRASQLGFDVACIEREPELGGTCLRIGCIPSKALLESSGKYLETQGVLKEHGIDVSQASLNLAVMHKRKDKVVKMLTDGVAGLFKKNNVTRYEGTAHFTAPNRLSVSGKDGETELEAARIIIATGSSSVVLPGIELDGERVGTSTDALAYSEVPEQLVVIGAGYIGLELGSVWKRLGAKVTVIEYLDRILPGMDAEIAGDALKIFKKQGLEFRLRAQVLSAKAQGDKAIVEIEGQEPLEADRVLVAVGRKPNTEGLNLEGIGLNLDNRCFIPIGEGFRTKIAGVYAIGDVIGGAMLAHKAEEEGIACVEGIATGVGHVNYGAIPGVAYTEPEIASVGKTEEQLKEDGLDYKKGVFPFVANGRARALGHTDGKVEVLADAKTDKILGVHILGSRAGDLIAEAVAAIEFGASSEDIARTSHAHPTLAEAFKEAALAVDGRPIHI